MSVTRDELHRLVDEVPSDELEQVRDYLRHLVGRREDTAGPGPRRTFRFAGMGQGPSDLAARAKEIAREELGRGGTSQ
ncbi:hypothetical protein GCM10011581_46660 [Saccharopolyspora subtropica]|uniref:DUF2281 domain-containing protein n=1 Tax=Saccharopolyspora thermophila TaxID=89367 RepID=A0A917K9P1_9PSEU|nr:hypothetical protein [Saccharopolyspora subtropica]GGJ04387.1 hypothetical protein GCM10011581_46660 [Saccharopolyspora subtropica]